LFQSVAKDADCANTVTPFTSVVRNGAIAANAAAQRGRSDASTPSTAEYATALASAMRTNPMSSMGSTPNPAPSSSWHISSPQL